MAQDGRDGGHVDEPVQRIALDQVQFQALLADVVRKLRGHAEQIYEQANPLNDDSAGILAGAVGAVRADRREKLQKNHERFDQRMDSDSSYKNDHG
ncbi:hypothetical protein Bca101_043762 [Brassica carinata]